jgi:O-antigen ligase
VGVHACRLYCLQGTGWGGFPEMYREELMSVSDARIQERGSTFEPHNIFLLAVIETGVLGLIIVVVGFGVALYSSLKLPPSLRAPPVAAVLATVVSSFFLSNFSFKFFWAVLIFAAVSETVAAGSRRPVEPVLTAHPELVAAGKGHE